LPRSPPLSPLFPYTTLFRSDLQLLSVRPNHNIVEIHICPRPVIEDAAGVAVDAGAAFGVGIRIGESDGPFLRLRLVALPGFAEEDRKSTRLNSSHVSISYAV